MAKRRGSGEGSIYRRSDGRWCGQVWLGYKEGGLAKRKFVYGRTRSDVSETLKRILRDQQMGIPLNTERESLGSYLKDWLENCVKPKNRHQTVRSYDWIIRIHIGPELGKIPLAKLTPQRLQKFLNERHASGLSATTVRHINATLRAALSQAQRWQLVHQNVAKLVTLPYGTRYLPSILTSAQAKSLLEFLDGHKHEALISVALTMGLRRGEILGLRWSDVDLASRSMTVRHSLERIHGTGLQLSEPKSARSKRSLTIPQLSVRALVKHRISQEKLRSWAGPKWKEGDFVFTTDVGTPMPPDEVSRLLPEILHEAGLPKVRFHDLRHSCASLLLSLGVPAKLVQETLGHSTYQLTMDTYSHMIPALRNEVASRMDEIFPTAVSEAVNVSTAVVN
jgi:integrase